MKGLKSSASLMAAIAVTPPLLLVAIASAGAGHGGYVGARLLFPYTYLAWFAAGETLRSMLFFPTLLLAFVQYPLYGWAVGRAFKGAKSRPLAVGLAAAHAAAALLSLLVKDS